MAHTLLFPILIFMNIPKATAVLSALVVVAFAAETAKPRFDPVKKKIEGWTVFVEPAMLKSAPDSEDARSLAMLEAHLRIITAMVPADRVEKLRKLEIWVERDHPTLKSMQYHPEEQWLRDNGHDPRLAKKYHVPVARNLISSAQLAKHPMVVLHELAHAYHDQVLSFEEPRIIAAYEKAKASGSYEKVLLFNGDTVSHYALTNHKEYFAEGTEAFFNRNDFYPFVRAELKLHDPTLHDLLLEIWGEPRN
jgi:dipeptidyl-peptidase-4